MSRIEYVNSDRIEKKKKFVPEVVQTDLSAEDYEKRKFSVVHLVDGKIVKGHGRDKLPLTVKFRANEIIEIRVVKNREADSQRLKILENFIEHTIW